MLCYIPKDQLPWYPLKHNLTSTELPLNSESYVYKSSTDDTEDSIYQLERFGWNGIDFKCQIKLVLNWNVSMWEV